MDLNRYISENLDYIIENQNKFIPCTKNKYVQFDLANMTNMTNMANSTDYEINSQTNPDANSDYNDNDNHDDNLSDVSGMYDDELDESNELYHFDVFNYDNWDNTENFNNYDNYDDNFNKQFKYKYNTTQLYGVGDGEFQPSHEDNQDDYLNDNIGDLFQELYENNNFDSYKPEYDNVKNCVENKNISLENSNSNANTNENSDTNSNSNTNENKIGIDELMNDDGYYYFNLMNLFVKYYNNKFDKIDNLFSNVTDFEKGTSFQMELFMDSIIEYKLVKQTFFSNQLDLDSNVMKFIFENDSNREKIANIFQVWEGQIYLLEINNQFNYISPSLIICLNWIYENNLSDENWNIYNLKNI